MLELDLTIRTRFKNMSTNTLFNFNPSSDDAQDTDSLAGPRLHRMADAFMSMINPVIKGQLELNRPKPAVVLSLDTSEEPVGSFSSSYGRRFF